MVVRLSLKSLWNGQGLQRMLIAYSSLLVVLYSEYSRLSLSLSLLPKKNCHFKTPSHDIKPGQLPKPGPNTGFILNEKASVP